MAGLVLADERQTALFLARIPIRLRFCSGRDISAATASPMVIGPIENLGDRGDDRRVDAALACDARRDGRGGDTLGQRATAAAVRRAPAPAHRQNCAIGRTSRSASRSPRPDSPISVSGRAPKAAPMRRSSTKPRVTMRRLRAGAKAGAGDRRPRRWRTHSSARRRFRRRSDRRSNSSGNGRPRKRSASVAASASSSAATTTAVGRPLATSVAKLGPESAATGLSAGFRGDGGQQRAVLRARCPWRRAQRYACGHAAWGDAQHLAQRLRRG